MFQHLQGNAHTPVMDSLPTAVVESDSLILMNEITATDAARGFADVLDAVEHRGERFTIVRHGRAVATLEPVRSHSGRRFKEFLHQHHVDEAFASDVVSIRDLLVLDDQP